jgi:hypothetical protein
VRTIVIRGVAMEGDLERAANIGADPATINAIADRLTSERQGETVYLTEEQGLAAQQMLSAARAGELTEGDVMEAWQQGAINDDWFVRIDDARQAFAGRSMPFVESATYQRFQERLRNLVDPEGAGSGGVLGSLTDFQRQSAMFAEEAEQFLFERAAAQYEAGGLSGLSIQWYQNQVDEFAKAASFLRGGRMGGSVRYRSLDEALDALQTGGEDWRAVEDEVQRLMSIPGLQREAVPGAAAPASEGSDQGSGSSGSIYSIPE